MAAASSATATVTCGIVAGDKAKGGLEDKFTEPPICGGRSTYVGKLAPR